MKILILEKEEGSRSKIGGVVIHQKRLQDYLEKHGYEVFKILFTNSKIIQKGIFKIPYYYMENRSFIFLPSEQTISLLKKYIIKIKPDLVYFPIGISPLDIFIPKICHDLHIPIIGIWHADINDNNSVVSIFTTAITASFVPVFQQLDKLIVFSEKIKVFFTKHQVIKNRIAVIGNGVDTIDFSPDISSFKKQHHIKVGIIFIGRLTLVKNPRVLIKSFLALNPPVGTKLIMVGDGELKYELTKEFRDKRIIFTGLIKDEKVKADILRAANIFVLPSSIEGISLALLEAMSTGLACVTTDVASHPSILKDAGICLSLKNLKTELPLTLKILLDNPVLQTSLGERAREKTLRLYQQDNIFAQYTEVFEQTVSGFNKNSVYLSPSDKVMKTFKKNVTKFWRRAKKLGAQYFFLED